MTSGLSLDRQLAAKAAFAPDLTLRLSAVGLVRGGRPILQGFDFQAKAGEVWAIRGANGAGKTSLLRLLAGLLPLAAGNCTLSGHDTMAAAAHYIGHLDGLKNARTLGEEIAYQAALYGQKPGDAAALLAGLGLAGKHDMPVGDLSAGQRRRLLLARLVLAPRPLWLLDEPLTALDDDGRALLAALVGAHIKAHGLVVASSHDTLAFASHEMRLGGA